MRCCWFTVTLRFLFTFGCLFFEQSILLLHLCLVSVSHELRPRACVGWFWGIEIGTAVKVRERPAKREWWSVPAQWVETLGFRSEILSCGVFWNFCLPSSEVAWMADGIMAGKIRRRCLLRMLTHGCMGWLTYLPYFFHLLMHGRWDEFRSKGSSVGGLAESWDGFSLLTAEWLNCYRVLFGDTIKWMGSFLPLLSEFSCVF